MDTNSLLVVAFDPGKRTGIAAWDWFTGQSLSAAIYTTTEAQTFLTDLVSDRELTVKAIVYERYIPGPALKSNDRAETSEMIGEIKATARALGVPLAAQMPGDRLIAAKWAEVTVPKGHMPDDLSAWLHGYYYLRQHQRITTPLEFRSTKRDKL